MAKTLNFIAFNLATALINGGNNLVRGAKHVAHGGKVAAQGAKDAAQAFKHGADYARTINKVSGQRAEYAPTTQFDLKKPRAKRAARGTKG